MSFSADTALQIAMRMEKLGQMLYESLAKAGETSELATIAAKLLEDEKKHLWTFERMYYSIPIEQCGAKMTEEQLAAAAGKYYSLILPTADEIREIVKEGDAAKLVAMAMQMESDAIAYYSSMTGTVKIDTAVIRAIAEEEKKHLQALSEYKERLRA